MFAVYYEDDLPNKLWATPVIAVESWEIIEDSGAIFSDIVTITYIEGGSYFDFCEDTENYLGLTFSAILDIDDWHPQITEYLNMIKRRNLAGSVSRPALARHITL
jgi:hypothetical protein